MLKINNELRPADLRPKVERLWEVSAPKILALDTANDGNGPAPVFTVQGKYTGRGWTDWTQGFEHGSALLQFDAFWDERFLTLGRDRTIQRMGPYVTQFGSDDHGFNNVSTYGNLWRLLAEGRLEADEVERHFYELALKSSGAVQAQRWTHISNGEGFIHSFNGPHSLFAESIRSLRSLALAHKLGHVLMAERDEKISLLRRLIEHARTTAKWSVFYGTGRDSYDVRGRVAQESIFNVADGSYRCPGSQQGYSPFTTCMRALAWIMLGTSEQLEYIATVPDGELEKVGGREAVEAVLLNAARATCDYYIEHTPTDGIPYWDTGAPGLHYLGHYLDRPAEPYNDFEPVDSSAATIAAQGLLRLGNLLTTRGQFSDAERYWQAGLTIVNALFDEPYLCADPNHQGLILHGVYHRPNGWDHIPPDRRTPCGEATMWGDYHAREVALYLQRVYEEKPYLTFFGT
jgi:hypothetical protein